MIDCIYQEYQKKNIYLVEYLENAYQDQLKIYQELDQLVNQKIKNLFQEEKEEIALIYQRELDEFNLLEEQRLTFQVEEEHLNRQIQILEERDRHLEDLKIEQLSRSYLLEEEIEELTNQNHQILVDLKKYQSQKQNYQTEKEQYFNQYLQEVTQMKTFQKGQNLVAQERSRHLQKRKDQLDHDYQTFQNQWQLYLDKVNDKTEEINETITILEEELKNKNQRQQLERRKTVTLNRQWLEESRRNKKQIQSWLQENQKTQENYQILKNQEQEWILNLKREHQILIDEKQADLAELEQNLKLKKNQIIENEDLIQDLEDKFQKTKQSHLDGTIKFQRKSLAALVQEKMILEDAYNLDLLDLNQFCQQAKEEIENNPFQEDLQKYQTRINKNLLSIEKIKKREAISVHQNKLYLREMRSHLEQLRKEIKENYIELEKVKKTSQNQNIRHSEEEQLYREKFEKYYQNWQNEVEYQEELEKEHQINLDQLKEKYESLIETVDFSLWDCQTQIDKTRRQSSQILKKIDQLEYQRNNLGKEEDLTLKRIHQQKKDLELEKLKLGNLIVLWQKDLENYQNKLHQLENDKEGFKISTLEKVQKLFQIRNGAEKELKLLEKELETIREDLKKSFQERSNLVRKVNQELLEKFTEN